MLIARLLLRPNVHGCHLAKPSSQPPLGARIHPLPVLGPKFATGILPRLMSDAKDDNYSALQRAHFIALIKAIPNAAYANEMTQACFAALRCCHPTHDIRLQLMSFFLRALQPPDLQIRANTIETLLAASAMGTHAAERMPASWRSTRRTHEDAARLHQAKSTQYLHKDPHRVPALPRHAAGCGDAEVLRELGDALDDVARYCPPDLLGKILTHIQCHQ
ncbi:hypothetical protein B0H13DRAFT_2665298 [Mycena leptocephala]|nr:hypothetical protein B0H13DRAFT_2665298 [Mycena leptocephala]